MADLKLHSVPVTLLLMLRRSLLSRTVPFNAAASSHVTGNVTGLNQDVGSGKRTLDVEYLVKEKTISIILVLITC